MPFTRIAEAQRKLIETTRLWDEMSEKGWCPTLVALSLLDELGIPYELSPSPHHAPSSMRVGVIKYAPVWVYGVVDRIQLDDDRKVANDILRDRLLRVRDSREEQEAVVMNLLLDQAVPSAVRDAARNFENSR
jgi:hypothetical protein